MFISWCLSVKQTLLVLFVSFSFISSIFHFSSLSYKKQQLQTVKTRLPFRNMNSATTYFQTVAYAASQGNWTLWDKHELLHTQACRCPWLISGVLMDRHFYTQGWLWHCKQSKRTISWQKHTWGKKVFGSYPFTAVHVCFKDAGLWV